MGFKKTGYDQETLEDQFILVCDECGAEAHHPKEEFPTALQGTIEWLSEKARKFGWITRRTGKRGSPFQWVCPECKMKAASWWGETPKAKAAVRA